MSGFHNNANWIAPNVIEYCLFNSPVKLMYFTPTGQILGVYSWYSLDSVVTNLKDIQWAEKEALKIVDQMQVMPTGRTLTGKSEMRKSPAIKIKGYDYDIQQLMALYFMEHSTKDTTEIDNFIKNKYPYTSQEEVNARAFIAGQPKSSPFKYELWRPIEINSDSSER